MKIDTKVNNIPSLTWNWLKLNYAELKIDSEYKEKTNISTSRIPDGATYEKDSEKILMSVPPVETGMGKSVSTILYENNILPSIKDNHHSFSCNHVHASLYESAGE